MALSKYIHPIKDKQNRKYAIVAGNGPSLKDIDYALLPCNSISPPHYTITSNKN